jgi:plasmid stability protein
MATMSIRGLEPKVLARLKRQAAREGSSLNSLVLRLVQGDVSARARGKAPQAYDDLDALAGTWSAQQARQFDLATAPFSEVDRNRG